ncbi:MAG: DnaD domain protein [Chloroflexota bacterium]
MAMKPLPGFPGFPEGKLKVTPIPSLFFSDLLPSIDNLPELKVTLYAFWALAQKEGTFRYLMRDEIADDALFMAGLSAPGREAQDVLDEALERAVARGTLLKARLAEGSGGSDLFFLNTPKGRAALEALQRGAWRPSGRPEAPVELQLERPNLFSLYEQNIGPLTPMIADVLRQAQQDYPASWIEDAVRIAVENNVRKWRYIEAILEDWRTRGRDEREDRGDTEKARRRYVEGEFADFIEH